MRKRDRGMKIVQKDGGRKNSSFEFFDFVNFFSVHFRPIMGHLPPQLSRKTHFIVLPIFSFLSLLLYNNLPSLQSTYTYLTLSPLHPHTLYSQFPHTSKIPIFTKIFSKSCLSDQSQTHNPNPNQKKTICLEWVLNPLNRIELRLQKKSITPGFEPT